MSAFVQKIKRGETPFFAWLNRTARAILKFRLPSYRPIHIHLYRLHVLVRETYYRMYSGLWCVPAFMARCTICGDGLRLPNGMPLVIGNPKIVLGSNVQILDSTIASGHVNEEPLLLVGDNVTIGYHSDISVALHVEIGDNTKIAKDCYIADNDGHPLDPKRRHEAVNEDEIKPVVIGRNVWIGTGCTILKGVTIADNCVIAANSVVTEGNIQPNPQRAALYGGSPARFIKYIEPEE